MQLSKKERSHLKRFSIKKGAIDKKGAGHLKRFPSKEGVQHQKRRRPSEKKFQQIRGRSSKKATLNKKCRSAKKVPSSKKISPAKKGASIKKGDNQQEGAIVNLGSASQKRGAASESKTKTQRPWYTTANPHSGVNFGCAPGPQLLPWGWLCTVPGFGPHIAGWRQARGGVPPDDYRLPSLSPKKA